MQGDQRVDAGKRCVWITGAARGIGLGIARVFHAQGDRVVGIDLETSEELEHLAEMVFQLDVSDHAGVANVVSRARHAGLLPDTLVNNAGIARDMVIWKMDEGQWDNVISVCLKGAYNMIHALAPLMREKAGGSIVSISSINALRGKFGQTNYCAAKAGLIGLSKAAARELGRFNIRVNVVAPGMVETEMTSALSPEIRTQAANESLLGRIATVEDVANAVHFLASDRARGITGQVLQVDCGQYL